MPEIKRLDLDEASWTPARTQLHMTTVQLIAHAESTTWQRLNGYLVASGFLFTAWPLAKDQTNAQAIVSIVGSVLSAMFAVLMYRSRDFVTGYVEHAKRLEPDASGPVRQVHVPGIRMGRFTAIAVPCLGLLAFAALLVVASQ